MLQLSHLHASTDDVSILRDFSLTVPAGEIHALMGPNGSGKSTLAHVLAGHPAYTVTKGSAELDSKDLLAMAPEERAAAGLFLAFQYPASLPGVSVAHFLRLAKNSLEKQRGEKITPLAAFIRDLRQQMARLHIPAEFAERSVNDGFSGGEKKRMEMLQMLVLRPRFVILDEIDSGLDVDAMKIVAEAVQSLRTEYPETSFLIITHYQRLLNHIIPDRVHIVREGQVQISGGAELAQRLEKEGYRALVTA